MGSVEFKTLITGVLFMFLLNIGLVLITGSTGGVYNATEVLNEVTSNMGIISGTITSVVLNIAIFVYGVFGVDFVASIVLLPLWVNSFLILYNTIIILSLLFYLIDRLWVG